MLQLADGGIDIQNSLFDNWVYLKTLNITKFALFIFAEKLVMFVIGALKKCYLIIMFDTWCSNDLRF